MAIFHIKWLQSPTLQMEEPSLSKATWIWHEVTEPSPGPSSSDSHPIKLLFPFIFLTQPGNFALPTALPSVRGYFKSYTKEKNLGTPHALPSHITTE